jgi:asparagine synthase (glutamine-hydrolysing)
VSAIYGIINFDGAPVDRGNFSAMGAALRHWGPDGGGDWIGPGAALGQHILATTEETRGEGPPHQFPRLIVVAAGRLDNRSDLVRTLSLPADAGDGAVIAAACHAWREDAPTRLYGDWALAAWEPEERRLFLARDHLGNTALYHHFDGRRLTFGSGRRALYAWPHVPRRLNEMRLAQHLTTWITDGSATFDEEILRLPPGNALTATERGLRISRFWDPHALPETRLGSDDEYVERFLHLYGDAVATRLRSTGPIATTLSAGLDSSSVTALAASAGPALKQRLIAFTARPHFAPIAQPARNRLVDEWPLARTVALRWKLDHRPLSSLTPTPIEAMRRSLQIHDEPEFASGNLHWILELFQSAQGEGAKVLLTGQLGNGGVSFTGDRYRILRLLLQGRIGKAVDEARACAKVRGISSLRLLLSETAVPIARASLGSLFRYGLISTPRTSGGLIQPDFAARLGVSDRMRRSGYDPYFSRILTPREQQMTMLLPTMNPVGALWHEKGAHHGLDVRDPTADVRLLEFCLQVPDAQFRSGPNERWLIRRAMKDILPSQLLSNRRRGSQGADIAARLDADAENVGRLLTAMSLDPGCREYLDLVTFRSRWSSLRADPAAMPSPDAFAFSRALLFGLFLIK